MSEPSSRSTQAAAPAAADAFLARFYRQMGVYAVAAALDLTLDPVAFARQEQAPPRPAPRKLPEAA
ncbi:MAG: hypothetical protein JNK46_02290 [Methylobacteriaceae bacterium]|nr:hypothetical protein [Methylobacteriaceae bacterium]